MVNQTDTISVSLLVHYTRTLVLCQELFREIFCQAEWIRLVTYLILDGLIIPYLNQLVKKKIEPSQKI